MSQKQQANGLVHDRALLLHGAKRNQVLTLEEVEQYGRDSFGDAEYVSLYGLRPREWYARGARILGRTAVECTRDVLADAIARTIVANIARLAPATGILAIDPFAGSCNTLSWILEHVQGSEGLAFELDPLVFELTRRNLALMQRPIELLEGAYPSLLDSRPLPSDRALLFFIAPPWGTAFDEKRGRLDLRRTTPPVTEILAALSARYPNQPLLFAVQLYEKLEPASFHEAAALMDRAKFQKYGLDAPGRNHGLLVGVRGWVERPAVGGPSA
jgi:hypothetical protein